MKDLKELIHILSRQRTYAIEIIGENYSNDTLINQFYNDLCAGKFETDQEAAQELCGTDEKSKKYKKLRSELKKRLTNTLFFIDKRSSKFNEYQRAYYNTCKDWAAMKIMLGREARNSAILLAYKILKQSKKHEFTAITLDVARVLRMHYGMTDPHEKRFETYNELIKEQLIILGEELEAEGLYERLVYRYVESKSTQLEIREEAARYARRLKTVSEKYATHQLRLYLYLIEVIQHMSINDYRSTLEVCERALAFFKTKDYQSKVTLITFLYQQLACQIQLHMLEEGKATAEACLSLMDPGPTNWFKAMELNFILSLHAGQYDEAFETMYKATKHKRFAFLNDTNREAWMIYEAYARFLYEVGLVNVEKDYKKPSKLKLGKFANNVPIFSKDRSGMNIPILIVQIMFYLIHERHGELIDKEESIRKYASRYLKTKETQRPHLFIKLLMLLPDCSFDKEAVREKAAPLLEQLREHPLEKANQSFEIEILPYEKTWEILLDQL